MTHCSANLSNVRFFGNEAQYAVAIGASNFSNITLQNSLLVGSSGSAIGLSKNANLRVDQCIFRNNSTPFKGGAIYAEKGSSVFTLNTIFRHNKAINSGGAIHIEDKTKSTFQNCLFDNNFSSKGGVFRTISSRIAFLNSNFTNNRASSGGVWGIFGGSAHVYGSRFYNNSATGDGGSLYLEANTRLTISKCNFTGNSALGAGGVMWITSSSVHAADILFENNSAGGDGGVISAQHHCSLNMTNTQCNGNEAISGVNGVLLARDAVNVIFTETKFLDNSAYLGGVIGIDSNSFLQLQRCQINRNTALLSSGAIAVSNNSLFIAIDTDLGNNKGVDSGALLIDNSTGYVENCQFTKNQAQLGGGVITMFAADFRISNTQLVDNYGFHGEYIYFQIKYNKTSIINTFNCSFQHGNIRIISNQNEFKQIALKRKYIHCWNCDNQNRYFVKETPYASSKMERSFILLIL